MLILSVEKTFILNVIMLIVIVLSAVAPSFVQATATSAPPPSSACVGSKLPVLLNFLQP
jgi:hypothetical protein